MLPPQQVWTVGHSTHPLPTFVALVRAHGVTTIADVRKLPRSRRHPHFNVDTLPASLDATGLGYTHFAGLGGLRREQPDSINRAWKNPSFRAYADYMQSDMFVAELDRLLSLGRRERVAVMCAEAVWWRCHRSLIADALVARGEPVLHILTPERAERHGFAGALRAWGVGGAMSGPPL
jgi:uncharacterized protein (DUF488 family)